MNSASPCKLRGSVLVLTLTLVTVTTALSLAGLERTGHQSELAAALARRAVLRAEAVGVLVAAAGAASGKHAQAFTPGCPPRCDWRNARRVAAATSAAPGVTAAYIAQHVAPGRFLIAARTTHAGGGEAVAHGLFDADAGVFRFVR